MDVDFDVVDVVDAGRDTFVLTPKPRKVTYVSIRPTPQVFVNFVEFI